MTTLKLLLACLALAVVTSQSAKAQEETENRVKIEDISREPNKTTGEDIDELITNKKMRAESGSKSKYSLASKLNYNGGSVERPLAEERPNIAAAPGTTDVAQLTGELSAKYAFNSKHSLMAGVGLRYITPLAGIDTPKDKSIYNGNKFDADNPYLFYQYVTKFSGIQTVLTAQPRYITQSNMVKKNYVSDLTLAATTLYDIGQTGLSFGLYSQIYGAAYNKTTDDDNDYGVGVDPFVEYQMTDKLNLRTVFNLWNYDHSRSRPIALWAHEDLLQSFGVGISVTRDVFLYPNVQFVLDHIRADRTNVALNTAINLF